MTASAELLAAAAPTCKAEGCEARVVRVEFVWHLDDDGRWRPTAWWTCERSHRVRVELLP